MARSRVRDAVPEALLVTAIVLFFGAPNTSGALGPAEQIPSASCLSCHESGAGAFVTRHTGHVVEVVYDDIQRHANAKYRRSAAASGLGSTVEADLLVAGRIECTTCHVSHDREAATRNRIRTGADATPLCLGCHKLE